jgi:hypothetical protein
MVQVERKGLSSVPISPHSGWLGLRDRIEIYLYVPVEKWLNGASFEALAPQRERHREDAVEMPLAARLPLGTGMHAVRRQIIAASASARVAPIGDSHDDDPRVATVLHIGSSATVHRSQDWSCHICQQCRKWRDVFVRLLGRNNPGGVATDDISDPFGILYILMSAIYIFFRISSIGISDLCTTSRLATAD